MALENFKFYKIRLDRADMTIAAPLTAKEGAVNGNGIELQIINGSIIDDMTNIAVYLNWKHLTSGQQGSEPFVLYDLAKGIYRIHYPTEMLSLGTIRADIKVVDAQSVTVSTSELLIKVAQAATDSTTQSTNAWNDIQTILVNQQVISERLTELENGGIVGPPGADGNDGKSAYEIAVQNGFIGTEVEWLASLKGADGADGINGTDGKSTYQIALDNGFVGTEAQWLASLKGADGTDGIDGTNGTNGTNGTDGADGKSAYQSALDGGFVGTELQFNEALAEVNNKQEALVSGTNIKTINGNNILGSGDLSIASGALKNWIINGMFDVWQRGITQTGVGYGSDDRFINEHNGSSKTHSRQSFTIGQTDVPNNPTYFSRTIVTSVAGAGNHTRKIQFIEDVTKLAGKTVTVSFWAKADTNKNISIEFIQAFGTGGSTTVTGIGVQKFPLTTAWQRFTKTIALPSINGKTIGANNLMGLYFWLDAGSDFNARTDSLGQQSGTFDIANVSLVEGSVAVECQNQPYADVLRDCLRYYLTYQDSADNIVQGFGIGENTTRTKYFYQFPIPMRKKPTVTYSNISVWNVSVGTYPVTAISMEKADESVCIVNLDTASGGVNGRPMFILANGLGAYIAFDAEL